MTIAQIIQLSLVVSIFLTVFAFGLDASWSDATWLFRHPGLLIRSLLSMNVLMVLFAVAAASVFHLSPPIKIAIVAISLSPVPPFFPGKQVKTHGSSSYAIGLMVAAALFALVLIPTWLELLGVYFGLENHTGLGKIVTIVLTSTIAPLFLGILFRRFAPALAEKTVKPVSLVAKVLLVIAVLPVLFTLYRPMWEMLGNGVVLMLALFAVIGLVVGHLLGGPDPDNRSVLAQATSARHPGITMAIAGLNFPQQKNAVMVVVVYHLLVSAIVAIPYIAWRKRQHAGSAAN